MCSEGTYVQCWCPSASAPTISNLEVTNKTKTSATINASVTDTGGEDPNVHIYWGKTDCQDNVSCWQNQNDANLGTKGTGSVSANVSNLSSGTTYYYRAYATNSNGSVLAASTASFVANNTGGNNGGETGGGNNGGGIVLCDGNSINKDNLKTYQVGDKWVAYDGLVPCGRCSLVNVNVDDDGQYKSGGEDKALNIPCQLCHIFVMTKGILDFILLQLVPVIAVLLLTVGGVMYLTSRGNPGQITQAKNILTATVVGLVIIYASWLIVNTVFANIGLAQWTGNLKDAWFQVNCSINLPN
jgi:hypothetical protein